MNPAPLACPHCGEPLLRLDRQLRCDTGHHFDLARGGHVHLATTRLTTGDTTKMLAQRSIMLARGVLEPLHAWLLDTATPILSDTPEPVVCDIGAGTGDLLARLVAVTPTCVGVAIDASAAAARVAQRAHERIQAVVADAWQPLPLRAHSVTVLTSVFAPRNAASFAHVLDADGIVIVASAGPRHLIELREYFGLLRVDERKDDRLAVAFAPHFLPATTDRLTWEFACDSPLAYAMMAMGPNAHHGAPAFADVTFTGTVTCDVMVHQYRLRS